MNCSQSEPKKGIAMQEVKERLLTSWLMMITAVDSERIPTQLPYNEAVVCNLLYTNKDKEITATDLCTMTKIMKSQMNRILTNLEEKGLIERVGGKRFGYWKVNAQ